MSNFKFAVSRSDALRELNWRKRKQLYVRLELLTNSFCEEISYDVPVILCAVTVFAVSSVVLAIKMTSMESCSVSVQLIVTVLSRNYIMTPFLCLRAAESLGTESLGILEELRFDAGKELKRQRLAKLLTRRRIIRPICGCFMFIESGTATAFMMTVLDNVVTGIFMVVPTATSYFM